MATLTDDDGDPLAEAMAASRKKPLKLSAGPMRPPMHDRPLSDEELLAKYDDQEDSRFDIPDGMEPPGMKYEWKSRAVLGKDNVLGMSRYLRRGWQFVPAGRHPGYWTSADASPTGPIDYDGMVLMEIEAATYHELRRVDRLHAKAPVRGIYDRLSAAPPGTGPRDAHPKTMPRVSRTYEPLPVEA